MFLSRVSMCVFGPRSIGICIGRFLRITTIGGCDCATLVFLAEYCNYSPIIFNHDFINLYLPI